MPSRWINRLTNLLGGLVDQGGPECLSAMRGRGAAWVKLAEDIAAVSDHLGLMDRNGFMFLGSRTRMADITDGSSNTLAIRLDPTVTDGDG